VETRLNGSVFWPPFLLTLAAVVLNLADAATFRRVMEFLNRSLLDYFGWLFVFTALGCLLLCAWVAVSPLGRVRLGGADAKPLMSRWNWFAITLCTTIAIGILFWSTAEPLSHFHYPPRSLGLAPQSPAAQKFAISALYLHWTLVPYSIYGVASLMFAFAHYNMRQPFSLGSMLAPILGNVCARRMGPAVDAVCLYSLVAGMAAALGTGILAISGGLHALWHVPRSTWLWAAIAASIVGTFVVSSASGLMRGIRILSDINAKCLLGLGLLVGLLGPTPLIVQLGFGGGLEFIKSFVRVGVMEPFLAQDEWAQQWSVFYWAVWIAWTPITACFLGRIAYGRTVREFLLINWVAPSLFCLVWMAIWGTTTLHLEAGGAGLNALQQQSGTEAVSYRVLAGLPQGTLMVAFYLVSAFICFVTSADSNTTAMASISSCGVNLEHPEGSTWVKVAWGALIGLTAWIMISFAEVDGIRMLSNLGGFPAACFLLFVLAALARVSANPARFDRTGKTSDATAEDPLAADSEDRSDHSRIDTPGA
jgi:choline-glycine betaine transporter